MMLPRVGRADQGGGGVPRRPPRSNLTPAPAGYEYACTRRVRYVLLPYIRYTVLLDCRALVAHI